MNVFSALIESLDQDVGCIPKDLKAQYLQDCVRIMEQMGAVCVPKCSVKQTMLTCVFKKPWTRNINHETWRDYKIIRNAMHPPNCAYWSHSYGTSFYLEPYILWPRFALFNPKFLTRNSFLAICPPQPTIHLPSHISHILYLVSKPSLCE